MSPNTSALLGWRLIPHADALRASFSENTPGLAHWPGLLRWRLAWNSFVLAGVISVDVPAVRAVRRNWFSGTARPRS
jgi:hypothetical protein